MPEPSSLQPPHASPCLRAPAQGLFITFEGGEGAGKSTQVARAAGWLQGCGIPVLTTREPGGTPLGKEIRALALEGPREGPDACRLTTELFLMLADRAQHVAQTIRPALQAGTVVLCDRFNDSTLAYQLLAGGLNAEAVQYACSLATNGLTPNRTILLDMDPTLAMARLARTLDRMEQKGLDFHHRVRQAFLNLASNEPARFAIIDAAQPVDATALHVQNLILELLRVG